MQTAVGRTQPPLGFRLDSELFHRAGVVYHTYVLQQPANDFSHPRRDAELQLNSHMTRGPKRFSHQATADCNRGGEKSELSSRTKLLAAN